MENHIIPVYGKSHYTSVWKITLYQCMENILVFSSCLNNVP